jgi:thioredoxin
MKKKKSKIVAALCAGVIVVTVFAINVASASRHEATDAPVASEARASIKWYNTIQPALAKAKETGKPIMIDFYATWCVPCKMLDASTYRNANVVTESENWVMVRIDVDQNQELAAQYGVESVPTIVLLSSDGKEKQRNAGFIDAGSMQKVMTSSQHGDS